MLKKKLANLGLSAAVATSMIATPMAGIYADTDNATPAPNPGHEISNENENAQHTNIVEAEENIEKLQEILKKKHTNSALKNRIMIKRMGRFQRLLMLLKSPVSF